MKCDECGGIFLWGLTKVHLPAYLRGDQPPVEGKLCDECLPKGLEVGLVEDVAL